MTDAVVTGERVESASRELIVVSNRLPVTRVDGAWETSSGGLVAALGPVLTSWQGAWVGWCGEADADVMPFRHRDMDLVPVALTAPEVAAYYDGLSNATLWPLYHHAVRSPVFDRDDWWSAYERVNERVAGAVADTAATGATVWVHDYHLQLVPERLRHRRPDLRIGFFLHIPFPPIELFHRLPWRDGVINGLLGADLLGFQTDADADNFRVAVGSIDLTEAGEPAPMAVGDRQVDVHAFPISIDVESCERLAADAGIAARARALRTRLGSPDIVFLGVDRLDYTKGIVERLEAFDRLLHRRPALAERTAMIQIAVPSRERVSEYELLRDQVERLVGRINGDHARLGRPVLHYVHDELPFEEIVELYLAADVLVVTALADGMNLVAKEFAVARAGDPASLVISEFAGAAAELGDAAIVVNAFDIESVIGGLERAMSLDSDERRRRTEAMATVVRRRDVHAWAEHFLARLTSVRPTTTPGAVGPG